MAPKPSSNITPLKIAVKEAIAMIRKDDLPTHKQLAERWHCSTQRVQYVLRKIKAGNPPPKRRGRPPGMTALLSYAAVQPKHPILAKLSNSVTSAAGRLSEVERHITMIPGLAAADRKTILHRAQEGVWQGLLKDLNSHAAAVSTLAGAKRKVGK